MEEGEWDGLKGGRGTKVINRLKWGSRLARCWIKIGPRIAEGSRKC